MKINIRHEESVDLTIVFNHNGIDKRSDYPSYHPAVEQDTEFTSYYSEKNDNVSLVIELDSVNNLSIGSLSHIAGAVARNVIAKGYKTIHVQLDQLVKLGIFEASLEGLTMTWVEGWLLGTYTFDFYKSNVKEMPLISMSIGGLDEDDFESLLKQTQIRAEGVMFARDLCNEPTNMLRPKGFADLVTKRFSGTRVSVNIFEEDELVERKMNGLLSVGKGSDHPPVFVEMRYVTNPDAPLLALVGKGVTFDTGGISLKSGIDLSNMRMDMGGGAAIVGALDILSKSKVSANIVALIPVVENMPNGRALLPGDVITYADGTKVQVTNTDAEGRLILADALLYAQTLGASSIIDIATLTGACELALGPEMAGIWGDSQLTHDLNELGRQSGDKVWPMPLIEQYNHLLDSVYCDFKNSADVAYGGAITATLFLKRFVKPHVKWVHIDSAGVTAKKETKGYYVEGGSGFGVRLLTDYIASIQNRAKV